ncbi:MAG: efflux RND transporter periplasmic adaptor subunit [Sulfuricurvum sp.]|jgi:RND family efflux transporter MFP subunit|uniref:efflux RND transporter periplasmic adaptor subunit n=1 Tax=Sulfuricurvum sp. TaxID=2025608 RepID=UPI0025F11BFE|nr:efflux RND transporter periplasmic adaptor subunit [Sulfuricurvum sp.]MCK9372805.1 efflux RND transporter periplasmic adaptor subunit [Sulfuricurvum sp.]
MNPSKIKYLQAIALLVSVILITGCKDKTVKTPDSTAVYVTTIAKSDGVEERWLSGSIRARVETDVGFRIGGKILKRLVNVGDCVTKAQPLAMLDNGDYQLALSAAEEQFRAASVNAKQSLSDAQRFQRLSLDGSMGLAEYERQKSRADAATAGMEQARSALELAKNKDSYTILRAPYDGVITAITMEVGQVIAEGQPLLSIAKEGEREVVVDLPEEIMTHVTEFKADAQLWDNEEGSVPLRLRELSPMATLPSRTYRARYVAQSGGLRFPLGSTLQLRLSRPSEAGVTLPLGAIIKTADEAGVWVLKRDGKHPVFVKVKILSYGATTVRVSGLEEKMRIMTVGAQKIDGSMNVTPIERNIETMDELFDEKL